MTERVLGPTGSRTRSRRLLLPLLAAVVVMLVFGVTSAIGSHYQASLEGSGFQIDTDANLKVDSDPDATLDWANVTEVRRADTASGSTDESFGQGAKEDTAVPAVVDGSIPPNKSDLKYFGVYQEGSTSSGFLNLYWSRVQDPAGTTNMDFEFNRRQCTPNQTPADPDCSGNGLTPIRSEGDLLIIYDLAQGGTNPILSLREWDADASEWGAPTDLTASAKATGTINTSAIPAADADGLGAHSARTFGEAQLALSAIFGTSTCESFGSAYLKSRSSDSFTAALKDFVPPVAVDISNCGRVVVRKTDGTNGLAGASFTISPANMGTPPSSSLALVGSSTSLFCIDHLLIGTQYTIHESVVPAGYNGAADQPFTPSTSGSCSGVTSSSSPNLTFANTRQVGALRVIKNSKDKSCTAVSGTCSALSTRLLNGAGFQLKTGSTVDYTLALTSGSGSAAGVACIDNVTPGSYTLHESTVPPGFAAAADQSVSVVGNTTCAGTGASAPSSYTVTDQPLTNVTVSVAPQVTGTTASKISCNAGSFTDGTPNGFDDTTETYTGVSTPAAGGTTTVTCTIVIDP
jgi:hypothetical protein